MDLFSILKADHKKVKTALGEMIEKESFSTDALEPIFAELNLHMECEEKYLYPRLAKIEETKDMAEEAVLEHKEAKRVLKDMQKELDDVTLKVKVELLHLELSHHIEEEEQEMFPKCKEVLSKEDLAEITSQIVAMREKAGVAAK